MRKIKSALALLLAFAMVATLTPTSAAAKKSRGRSSEETTAAAETTVQESTTKDAVDGTVGTMATNNDSVTLQAEGESIPTPQTVKTVTNNNDGTYTIQLDITGTQIQETQQTGANVLMVLDTTYSMASSMTGATNRFEAARSAALTLIDTLDCGTNDIDLALVEFDSVGSIVYNWTKDYTSFRNYMANTAQHATGPTGTNWESGLYYARQVLNSKDTDNTYVIFLTDGEPNRRGTTTSTNAGTSTAISYALTQAQAITGLSNTDLYGVFCGSATGYNNLNNMINNAGGVETINGTDADGIREAFAAIAQTIVNNLGANNVSVDDGVPSFANTSATSEIQHSVIDGEVTDFKYYTVTKNEAGEEVETEWTDAPDATYDKNNGVVWNLSKAGVLSPEITYRIKFVVWPSQDAYDLIADLNNGIKDYDEDLSDDERNQIIGSKEDGYTMATNTHLTTNYSFKDKPYSETNDYQADSMRLEAETISLEKLWPKNMLDGYGAAVYRDENGDEQTATSIKLTVTKDGEPYLFGDNAVEIKASDNWKKDNIYISCGVMTVKEGVASIKEPGHDYTVTEPAAFSYYWDLIADVYHPMVINGTPTMLVLDEALTSADNVDTFKIGDKYYKKHSEAVSTLEASNYRRSNLNLTKVVSTTGAPDEYFTYTVTVEDANSTDGNVWFSAWDPKAGATVKDADWVINGATAQDGNTGYWYAENGTAVTFKIKAGWNVRFLNLYHGSTFTFEETTMPDFFEFDKAEAAHQYPFMDENIKETDWHTITGKKVEGTIVEPNNSYTVTYTNKYEAFYVYHSGVAGDGNLEVVGLPENGGTYDLTQNLTANTLYGGYYLDYAGKGSYADDGEAKTDGVKYTGMNADWTDPQTVKGTEIKPVAGETYYIKEVPTYYLRNYHQINFVKKTGQLMGLYLISAIDDLNYNETGFTLTNSKEEAKVVSSLAFKNYATGKTVTLKANTVFKSLGITEDGEYLTYFDASKTDYFAEGTSFTVLPYWITPDGISVDGISTRTITITELTKSGISKSDE